MHNCTLHTIQCSECMLQIFASRAVCAQFTYSFFSWLSRQMQMTCGTIVQNNMKNYTTKTSIPAFYKYKKIIRNLLHFAVVKQIYYFIYINRLVWFCGYWHHMLTMLDCQLALYCVAITSCSFLLALCFELILAVVYSGNAKFDCQFNSYPFAHDENIRLFGSVSAVWSQCIRNLIRFCGLEIIDNSECMQNAIRIYFTIEY